MKYVHKQKLKQFKKKKLNFFYQIQNLYFPNKLTTNSPLHYEEHIFQQRMHTLLHICVLKDVSSTFYAIQYIQKQLFPAIVKNNLFYKTFNVSKSVF